MADPRLQWRQISQAQPNVAGLMRGSNESLQAAGDAARGILASYDKGQQEAGDQELARLLASATNQEELDVLVNSDAVRGLRLSENGTRMLNEAQGNRVDWSNTRSIIGNRDGRLAIAQENQGFLRDDRTDALARRDWERENAGLYLDGEQTAFDTGLAPASLVRTESGGNFGARNDAVGSSGRSGHFGRVQFGHDRFEEARAAGAVPPHMTIEEFGADTPTGRRAQATAERWHFSDIQNRINENGLDRYIGTTINGVEMTRDGMVAMAHLGGFGGLRQFLESGGRYNPSDDNGTSLTDYARTHAGNTTGTDRGGTAYSRAMAQSGLFSGSESVQAVTPIRAAAAEGQARIDADNEQMLAEITASANQELLDNPEINTVDQLRRSVMEDDRFTATENEARYRELRDLIEDDPSRLRPAVDPADLAATEAIVNSSVGAAERAIDANPQTSLLASADRMSATDTASVGQNLAQAVGLSGDNRENPTSITGLRESGFDQAQLDRLVARTATRNNVSEEVAAAAMARAYQDDPWGRNTLSNRFDADRVDEIIASIDQQDERDYSERRGNVEVMRTRMESLRSQEALIRAQMQQYPEGSQMRATLERQLQQIMTGIGQVESQLSTSKTN